MKCLLINLSLSLFGGMLSAQQTVNDTRIVSHDSIPHNLSFEAEAYYYILPGEKNTATLIGYADYKAFHSEVRYNYEDMQTVSVFGGHYILAKGGQGHRLFQKRSNYQKYFICIYLQL